MRYRDTLSEKLKELKQKGYKHDFNLLEKEVELRALNKKFAPDRFNVKEVHRFEGMSSAGDSSVIYAVETADGIKGTIVDAYGTYAQFLSSEMVDKLKFDRSAVTSN